MRTIALRFANNFAPDEGTIIAHEEVLANIGYVWYGKLGSRIATSVVDEILKNKNPKILLIHSGTASRYWAYIDKIQHEIPEKEGIPEYYRKEAENFKTWFRVRKFENAPRDVMSKCVVASSGRELGITSRHSMSPYFKIIAPD